MPKQIRHVLCTAGVPKALYVPPYAACYSPPHVPTPRLEICCTHITSMNDTTRTLLCCKSVLGEERPVPRPHGGKATMEGVVQKQVREVESK